MRISDWSSDVCSSDLISDWQKDTETLPPGKRLDDAIVSTADLQLRRPVATDGPAITALVARCAPLDRNSAYCNLLQCTHFADSCIVAERDGAIVGWVSGHRPRSEEHTSELQSLMRISYAVFCLKKKKNNTNMDYMQTHSRNSKNE